jgi:MFS transporter, DHA2 family, multidrug resistance protein
VANAGGTSVSRYDVGALGAIFVQRQRRLVDPLIDLGLFRRSAFSLALGANMLAFAVVFGIEVFVAQYFQLVLGYSPLEAGLWSVPAAAAFVVGSQLTPPLAARVGPPVAMLGGIVVAPASRCSHRSRRATAPASSSRGS